MRSVNRQSVACPEILTGVESRKAQHDLVKYFKLPENERKQLRPPINREILFHDTVRDSLRSLFSGKCAFCESIILGTSELVVEHFRPRNNSQNLNQKKQSSDHYGWFAYEWRNLFPACVKCNRSKGSLFPVRGPRANILSAWDDAEKGEDVLVLNPCKDKPYKHLEFGWDGKVFGRTKVGGSTIDVLSLNRPELVSTRSQCFGALKRIISDAYRYGSPFSESALAQLIEHLKDDSPYSGSCLILLYQSMCRATKSEGLTPPSFEKFADRIPQFLKNMDSDNWLNLGPTLTNRRADRPIEVQSMLVRRSESEMLYRHAASAQITRIEIENFKGISHLSLDIPPSIPSSGMAPCTMLLGENATGKSSFLQAVALCLMGSELRDKLRLNPQDYLPREKQGWQYTGLKEARVTIHFDSTSPAELVIKPTDSEFSSNHGHFPMKQIFGFGANRQFGEARQRILKTNNIQSLFDTSKLLTPPTLWLQRIDDDTFFAVARAIREVLALKKEDTIIRKGDGNIFVKAHSIETPIQNLSDGYRSLFSMVINIMRELIDQWGNLEQASGIVLLDEIEIHMHPRWKLRVVAALRRSMPKVHFIATTHDPLCLRGLEEGEVHVFYRDSDERIQNLSDLPNVKRLRAEQLLTSEYFGLDSTSDPELEQYIKNLALDEGPESPSISAKSAAEQREGIYLPLVTDSPERQVIHEAIHRYMEKRRDANPAELKNARENAVKKVLEALEKVGN